MNVRSGSRIHRIARYLSVLVMAGSFRSQAMGTGLVSQGLYDFGANPKNPRAGLVQCGDGNFYGTTAFGGTNGENGTIFRITPSGSLAQLFSFNGTNGSHPLAGLIQGSDGNLYGTTAFGGSNHGTNKVVPTLSLKSAGGGAGAEGRAGAPSAAAPSPEADKSLDFSSRSTAPC